MLLEAQWLPVPSFPTHRYLVIPTVLYDWLTSLVRNRNQTSDISHRDKQNIHFGPVKIFKMIISQSYFFFLGTDIRLFSTFLKALWMYYFFLIICLHKNVINISFNCTLLVLICKAEVEDNFILSWCNYVAELASWQRGGRVKNLGQIKSWDFLSNQKLVFDSIKL